MFKYHRSLNGCLLLRQLFFAISMRPFLGRQQRPQHLSFLRVLCRLVCQRWSGTWADAWLSSFMSFFLFWFAVVSNVLLYLLLKRPPWKSGVVLDGMHKPCNDLLCFAVSVLSPKFWFPGTVWSSVLPSNWKLMNFVQCLILLLWVVARMLRRMYLRAFLRKHGFKNEHTVRQGDLRKNVDALDMLSWLFRIRFTIPAWPRANIEDPRVVHCFDRYDSNKKCSSSWAGKVPFS